MVKMRDLGSCAPKAMKSAPRILTEIEASAAAVRSTAHTGQPRIAASESARRTAGSAARVARASETSRSASAIAVSLSARAALASAAASAACCSRAAMHVRLHVRLDDSEMTAALAAL